MHGNEHGISVLCIKCTVRAIRDHELELGLRPDTLVARMKASWEFLPRVFVSLQDVPHEALAYALTKPLFVVLYRPVRSLVQEIIQETEQP